MRRGIGGAVWVGLLLLAGCGIDTVATAELEPVCGEDGAFWLLALGEDEVPDTLPRRVMRRRP